MLKNRVFSSMFMCENFDTDTSTANNIFNKITTKDNLSASFYMIMQIRLVDIDELENLRIFLFLENKNMYKLMHMFEISNKTDEFKSKTNIDYTHILEFEDYSFPAQGNYLWSMYAISDEELLSLKLTDDTEALFEYFQQNKDYLINIASCNVS